MSPVALDVVSCNAAWEPLKNAETCEDVQLILEDVSTDTGSEPKSPSSLDVEADESVIEDQDTLVIIDWDDTILPTTWLDQRGLARDRQRSTSKEEESLLVLLSLSARGLLEAASKLGQVVIVTNATAGWVESTCARFLPSIEDLVRQVPIISARSTYDCLAPESPIDWKRLAFESEVKNFRFAAVPGTRLNFVSIGDSYHEYFSMANATADLKDCSLKLYKLVVKPDIHHLGSEQSFLASQLRRGIDAVMEDDRFDVDVGASVSMMPPELKVFQRQGRQAMLAYWRTQSKLPATHSLDGANRGGDEVVVIDEEQQGTNAMHNALSDGTEALHNALAKAKACQDGSIGVDDHPTKRRRVCGESVMDSAFVVS